MKKLILFLFIATVLLATAQVPQRFNQVIVTKDITSPKFIRTNSTADSVLLGNGGAKSIQSLKTDTTNLSKRINAKQDSLVSGVNIKSVNGSSILGSGNLSIVAGGGGAGANVYLSDVNSSVSGYKTSSPNIDALESVKTITASTPNTVYWGEKYLYTSPIATTNIPSGLWGLHVFGNVNSAVGVSSVVFRIFKYSGSTETVLFTFTGYEVDNIEASEIIVTGGGTETTLLSTDYLGIQVGFQTTAATAKTLTYSIGNGHASYSTNPLPLRHAGLRDKNGESDFQHVTTTQIGTWNSKQDALGFVPYNSTNPAGYTSNLGTVTNVSTYIDAAGNDIYVETSNNNTTPQINIHIPTASATKRGALSFADWNTFNNKLSSISYNQPSNASYQMLWGSGNSIYGNSNITCNPYAGSISATQFIGGGSGITGLTSGQITTALGYTPKPTFTENTAFNKNFGTSTGQVWGYDAHPTTLGNYGILDALSTSATIGSTNTLGRVYNGTSSQTTPTSILGVYSDGYVYNFNSSALQSWLGLGSSAYTSTSNFIQNQNSSAQSASFNINGSGTFGSTVNSTGFLLNGNNLTSVLSTNYIPKWNGSNFVNSLISEDVGSIQVNGQTKSYVNNASGNLTAAKFGIQPQGGVSGSIDLRIGTYGDSYGGAIRSIYNYASRLSSSISLMSYDGTSLFEALRAETDGTVHVFSTATSTSPTTGALVVSGGIGSGGNVFASGFKTSRNSASYLLATDGSDVAVSSIGGGVNEIQQTINGSVGGSIVCSEPFRGSTYKKIIIELVSFRGNATYTYPVGFAVTPITIASTAGVTVSQSESSVTITTSTNINGWAILEGY